MVCLIFTNARAALKTTNVKTKRQHKCTNKSVMNNEERGYHDINSRILTMTCKIDIVIYEKKNPQREE
jgi:hypothetical protein